MHEGDPGPRIAGHVLLVALDDFREGFRPSLEGAAGIAHDVGEPREGLRASQPRFALVERLGAPLDLVKHNHDRDEHRERESQHDGECLTLHCRIVLPEPAETIHQFAEETRANRHPRVALSWIPQRLATLHLDLEHERRARGFHLVWRQSPAPSPFCDAAVSPYKRRPCVGRHGHDEHIGHWIHLRLRGPAFLANSHLRP